jgi:hypothetical protein
MTNTTELKKYKHILINKLQAITELEMRDEIKKTYAIIKIINQIIKIDKVIDSNGKPARTPQDIKKKGQGQPA